MTTFDPARVPVGGTVRGRYSGRVFLVVSGINGDPVDGPVTQHNLRTFRSSYVRDPGRHVDPSPDGGQPPRTGRPRHRADGPTLLGPVGDELTAVETTITLPDHSRPKPWGTVVVNGEACLLVPEDVADALRRDLLNLDSVSRTMSGGAYIEHGGHPSQLAHLWAAADQFIRRGKP